MPNKTRPKAFQLLTADQKAQKLQKDSEYEIAHRNLTTDLKSNKITKGEFDIRHSKQWDDYLQWAIGAGLYEEITEQEQLIDAELILASQLGYVNQIRESLGLNPKEIKDKK
jgi:hypothetical protein